MQTIPYNRIAAVNYARKWAFARNPAYYNFDGIGGDCTNFVSQCLYAGSGIMNFTPIFGWYYLSLSDRTASWTGVEYLYNFLVNNQSVGPYATLVPKREARPGDVVQLGSRDGDFYHTAIVTDTSPRILVASHSADVLNKPLSRYRYETARFLHIDGVRV